MTATEAFTLQVAPPTMVSPGAGPLLFSTTGVTAAGATCTLPSAGCFLADPTISTTTNPSVTPSILQIRYTIAPAAPPTCTVGTSVNLQRCQLRPIPVNNTETIQAIACKTGYVASAVVNFTYTATLNPPVFPAVGSNGAPGTYDDTVTGFYFSSDGKNTAGTSKDPNIGALDLWYCYTTDNTAPGCGPVNGNAGTCANTADQTAIQGSGISGAGTADTAYFQAPNVTKTGTTIQVIACSENTRPRPFRRPSTPAPARPAGALERHGRRAWLHRQQGRHGHVPHDGEGRPTPGGPEPGDPVVAQRRRPTASVVQDFGSQPRRHDAADDDELRVRSATGTAAWGRRAARA